MGQLKLLESNVLFKKISLTQWLETGNMSPNSRWVSSITVDTFQCGVDNKKTQMNTTAKFSLAVGICFKSAWGFFFFFQPSQRFSMCILQFVSNNQRQKNDLKKWHACIGSAGFTVTSGRVADEQVPELRQERESCRWRLRASWFPPCTSSMGRGGVGMGEGPFSGIVWLTARDADCPRGLGPPAPPRRPTVTQTMQCYNCGSDLTPTPFKSRPHPIYSANPSWPPPTPSTDLDTGSGDTLSFHSVQFRHGGFALQLRPTKVNIFMTQIAAWHRRLLRFPRQRTEAGWVDETL